MTSYSPRNLTISVVLTPEQLQALAEYQREHHHLTRYRAAEALLLEALDGLRTVDSVAARWVEED